MNNNVESLGKEAEISYRQMSFLDWGRLSGPDQGNLCPHLSLTDPDGGDPVGNESMELKKTHWYSTDPGSIPSTQNALAAVGCSDNRSGADSEERYRVKGMIDVAEMKVPPLEYIWNGMSLQGGSIVEIIGSPSIGKSRFVSDLARNQILGRKYLGIGTLGRPLRWLFVGSENSLHRQRNEARQFLFGSIEDLDESERERRSALRGFSPNDINALNSYYRTVTLEDVADYDITLSNPDNVIKLINTLKTEHPDVVVFDPWGDLIAGDELKDSCVRETIRQIRCCLKSASCENTLVVIINHARIGVKEEANARGGEEGNFGKNSKCLFSVARYVLNIRRASMEAHPPIEIICAKNSDGIKPGPIACSLDVGTMSYRIIPDFDHDGWQSQLMRNSKAKTKANESLNYSELLAKTRGLVNDPIHEPYHRQKLANVLKAKGHSLKIVEAFLHDVIAAGDLCCTEMYRRNTDGRVVRDGSKKVYTTQEGLVAYKSFFNVGGNADLPSQPRVGNSIKIAG